MKNSFVRNRFVARRNLAFRDKARELSRKGAKSSDGSQMIFEYSHGATSYPTDVLPDGNQTRIKSAYAYTPYGLVTSTGSVTQPLQWSSEYADTDLALVYYNYRHYNPLDGRWCGRDLAPSNNEYYYVKNQVRTFIDVYGNFAALLAAAPAAVGAGALLPALGIAVTVIAIGAAAVYIWQQASETYDDSVEDTEADESAECRKNRREEECITQCTVRYHACLERGSSAKTRNEITPAIMQRCNNRRTKCELKCYQGKWPQE